MDPFNQGKPHRWDQWRPAEPVTALILKLAVSVISKRQEAFYKVDQVPPSPAEWEGSSDGRTVRRLLGRYTEPHIFLGVMLNWCCFHFHVKPAAVGKTRHWHSVQHIGQLYIDQILMSPHNASSNTENMHLYYKCKRSIRGFIFQLAGSWCVQIWFIDHVEHISLPTVFS